MKKLAILVALIVLLISVAAVEAANSTIVLNDPSSLSTDAVTDSIEKYLGEGSWANMANGTKFNLWLTSDFLFGEGSTVTIDDIQEISFYTLKQDAQGGLNFYINIYTESYEGGTTSWYGSRLTLEPMYSRVFSDVVGSWNGWSTESGTNQLTIFDQPRSGAYGWYYPPTLVEIQAGSINWHDYLGTAPATNIDYGGEIIKYIVVDTGSGWDATFNGNVDALVITLKNADIITIDLEPQIPTKAEILMGSGVLGKGLNTAPGLQKPFNPKSQAGERAGKKD